MQNKKIKIAVLRETKSPPDARVAITPSNAVEIMKRFPNIEIYVQPSPIRCYSDDEYKYLNIPLKEDISDCDLLVGVKEVDKKVLIPNKTYMFFAHVAKKQRANQALFQEIIHKKIKLIDYEYITNHLGKRLVAFGRWAGIVGAYNTLRARGLRTDNFQLKPAHECHDMEEMFAGLKLIILKPIKILLTGGGRAAKGALETLSVLNLKEVKPKDFLHKEYNEAVFCRIDPWDYAQRMDGEEFELHDFYNHPEWFESKFPRFTKVTDMLITCHYWNPNAPKLFTPKDMKDPSWKISIIGDISCDINGSVPTTVRPSSIMEPFYGYNRSIDEEVTAFANTGDISVMAIDNLPSELPRNSSSDFGKALVENVFAGFVDEESQDVIRRAQITKEGKLTKKFSYLQDYLDGKEFN